MNNLLRKLELPIVYTLSFMWLVIIATNITISFILFAELI
jgi:hypothetical protein